MPDELEYIVDKAVCHCDKGAAPNFFKGLANQNVKINGCMACTKADKIPLANIPSFGVCSVTGSTCTPAPTDWTDTYKVKIKGKETLLFKSKLPCSIGGKVEFITSGQIPVSEEDLAAMTDEHSEEQEDEGWGWWDTAELIPVVGSVIGIVRSAAKGDWWMAAANVGFLALDVAGLVSFGATTAASTAAKGGLKAGLKVAGKAALKSAGKVLTKQGAKALAKGIAKHVDDIAKATMKVCVFACFPAGTLVHTSKGQKAIEDILEGDEVWAWDEETNTTALKNVISTMQREVDATVEISLEGETIETTAEHPFYTRNGWKDAADLNEGEELITKEGKWKPIKKHGFSYQKRKVFNFEVAGWHTYFVGVLAWLVHNAAKCITGAIKEISKRLKYLGRTPGKASRTGKEVFERMKKAGTAREVVDDFGNVAKEFYDAENKIWRNIKEADMGHIEDAVSWWNKTGRNYGAKSKEVREWMLDSKNYVYEYYKTNRSKGAQLLEEYLPPLK
ncbi:polymorphic toxin-type HINT domain-containing protein [Pedobacter sp. AW1-32]|uniref:polymorphic toxin-type HINT domain-containing protein n=1 Tax=Pedobacter sp. AW1-32 TaxID=3383026 RepID=UPI003FEFE177